MTMTMAPPLTGAPYMPGDPVVVRDRPARVLEVKRVPKAVFGLQWALRCAVRVDDAQWSVEAFVFCDDNGRNVTKGQQVRPSDEIPEA